MSEEEHKKIVQELETKWLGKLSPSGSPIIDVYVDYRKDHQYMNRVGDENGGIYFIDELRSKDETN